MSCIRLTVSIDESEEFGAGVIRTGSRRNEIADALATSGRSRGAWALHCKQVPTYVGRVDASVRGCGCIIVQRHR